MASGSVPVLPPFRDNRGGRKERGCMKKDGDAIRRDVVNQQKQVGKYAQADMLFQTVNTTNIARARGMRIYGPRMKK